LPHHFLPVNRRLIGIDETIFEEIEVPAEMAKEIK